MKKIGILFLVLSLGLLPFKAGAMLKVDENGNPIEYEEKEGEYHTMLADEGNTGSGTTGNTSDEQDKLDAEPNTSNKTDSIAPDQTDDLDQSVSDQDKRDIASDGELYYTTGVDTKNLAENDIKESTTNKDNTVFYAVGSGVIGLSIGAALVYFLTKKH